MTEKDKVKMREFGLALEEARKTIEAQKNKNDIIKEVSSTILAGLKPSLEQISKTTKEAVGQYLEGIKKIELKPPDVSVKPADVLVEKQELPEINVEVPKAEVKVEIPEVKIPEFKTDKIEKVLDKAIKQAFSKLRIPAPIVSVKAPKIDIPPTKEVVMPTEMQIKGEVGLEKIDRSNPLHTILVDQKGQPYKAGSPIRGGGGGVVQATGLTIYNVDVDAINTEFSQVLPKHTKKFKIYAMDQNRRYPHKDVLKYTMVEGESGTNFIPLPPGGYDGEEGVDLVDRTIYFQTPSLTVKAVIVIKAWQ